jgi:hypothetical protein
MVLISVIFTPPLMAALSRSTGKSKAAAEHPRAEVRKERRDGGIVFVGTCRGELSATEFKCGERGNKKECLITKKPAFPTKSGYATLKFILIAQLFPQFRPSAICSFFFVIGIRLRPSSRSGLMTTT